ncbi:MAG: galactokinase [Planctomycetota bacterium]|jgi:galactokinase|nr:galactokinase [Planctomycetota bacterium]MDP6939499.1 galactokinase [Planctomycetota bacterium]
MVTPGRHTDSQARLEQLAAHASQFLECHGPGQAPRLFFSPGRVNLFGGHLDYNGGPVMPTAIDRGTFIAARSRSDRLLRMASAYDRQVVEIDLDQLPRARVSKWVDYPLGVVLDLTTQQAESDSALPGGLDILYGGDLPIGSGLSSSASICVGTAVMLDSLWSLGLSNLDRVRAALRAERHFVGVQCGIMDPYAIGCARAGHLLWLDCKDESIEYLPIDGAQLSILVTNTGVQRALAASEFNRRVDQCAQAFDILRSASAEATCLRDIPLEVLESERGSMDPVLANRAEHVIHEVRRTFEAREFLLAGDPEGMGVCMTQTHESLRSLYEVSCSELDFLVEVAATCPGAFGARLTGAGFGGCTVTLVRRGDEDEVQASLEARFEAEFGRCPTVEVFEGDPGPREIDWA